MIKKGLFETLDYPISTGKEANVFRASTKEKDYLAVKIYRVETATFTNLKKYIIGDPRFKNITKKYDLIDEWASKEFANLRICAKSEIHAPKPVLHQKNILVMEFLGYEGLPFPTLQDFGSLYPEEDLKQILEDIKKLYKNGLVHSDLSEYNIVITPNGPYFIDVGQAVILAHPKAEEFLERDVRNVLRYFNKYKIKKDLDEVLKWIRK